MSASDPTSYGQFLQWLEVNRVGDLTGIGGILISLIGFTFTVVGVVKSKSAAERAERAAKDTMQSMRLLDTVVEFSAAITALEEIKRLHREANWPLLPDRYAHIRKVLANLRTAQVDLSDAQKTVVQQALANLKQIEDLVERSLRNQSALNSARFNKLLSEDIENLLIVLNDLKAAKIGV
ncbi:hypothetical protein KQX64_23330 [Rhodopseudomonas palustris]|nr:hypothetical protein KQX64_23330 [Rhodopseudomonas palustris]